MSSQAWTEVATGEEARGVRRWLRRILVPMVLRRLIGLLIAVPLLGPMIMYFMFQR